MSIRFNEGHWQPSTFACPVCAGSAPKPHLLTVGNTQSAEKPGSPLHLYRCDDCLSLTYDPFPEIDYTQHTSTDLAVRDYVEFNAAIDLIARNILRAIPEGSHGRLLDIGCGFGFGPAAVRGMSGWQVKGYEPSRYGELGREQLKLDIVSAFANRNAEPGDRFDIVHCSEVIEHVQNPHEFIDILASYLTDAGVLILTTPDADRIRPATDPSSLLALLSPGAHTVLFSEAALTDALRAAGFAHVEIDRSAPSMLVYASRQPLRLHQRSPAEFAGLLHRYLQEALDRATPGTPLATGLRYRLFRSAMDGGDYALAETVFTADLADAAPMVDDIGTSAGFAARWPICIAASTYYLAMLMMIHRADYPGAARHFRAAARLCHTKIRLSPATAVVESDLLWRAVYHEALALKYAGRTSHALARLAAFVDFDGAASPRVPENLRPDVIALRDELLGLPESP
ncbi:class I SAM-dependent methyltransferase [Kaistia nematophila]|uniref:Class I SAM-dependent methyltransferase n=1 Tax=Kaistia nematophila TaxID=2994654 RepID=A0A9X3IJB9_9HYPH|nr:class I SAM-dependent methyltransferase [Kaistia nematophila]MCX5567587.1 class I SAM-dependent methyltransferase [Kaistia nematophila]